MHELKWASGIEATLLQLTNEYPAEIASKLRSELPRYTFNLRKLGSYGKPPEVVCDLGGGFGLYSLGCAALGMRATLIDDFRGEGREQDRVLAILRAHGVTVEIADLISGPLGMPPNTYDAITCFDCMEHLHHSPKRLFQNLMSGLRRQGLLFLSVPNGLDIWKRITVPLGMAKWSQMSEWYETDYFTGHVREPDVSDLRYIAQDLGLAEIKIFGRNWRPHTDRATLAERICASLLNRRPSLCLTIYMQGLKP